MHTFRTYDQVKQNKKGLYFNFDIINARYWMIDHNYNIYPCTMLPSNEVYYHNFPHFILLSSLKSHYVIIIPLPKLDAKLCQFKLK